MDVGEWRKAERAYKVFLKEHENAPFELKASAWHAIGQCRRRRGNALKAMEAFSQSVKEDGPERYWTKESARLAEEIGTKEMELWQEGALDGPLKSNRRQRALETMEMAVRLAPYGACGDKLQYLVGTIHMKRRSWTEAKSTFEQLLLSYPYSELRDDSYWRLCEIEYAQTRSFQYDQGRTALALNKLSDFLSTYTESPYIQQALEMKKELLDREAHQAYSTAAFYEKRKEFEAARLSYSRLASRYPRTSWAEKATQRLALLEERVEEERND